MTERDTLLWPECGIRYPNPFNRVLGVTRSELQELQNRLAQLELERVPPHHQGQPASAQSGVSARSTLATHIPPSAGDGQAREDEDREDDGH